MAPGPLGFDENAFQTLFRDKFVDFRRAYEEQGLAKSEFDGFGPTRKTLYGFTGACQDLVRVIRGYLLPGVG